MLKNKFVAALVAGMLAAPMAANAALVTQLLHFDDTSNGWKWYSDKDNNFLFDPTNMSSSASCAQPAIPNAGNNGSCVLETNNGILPRMTRPQFGPNVNGSPSQGDSNDAPVVSGQDQLFTLDAFYFQFDGLGNGPKAPPDGANLITVAGSNNTSFTFNLGISYSGPISTTPVITLYEGANAGALAGALDQQIGYIVSFGDLFKDVTWIQFSGADTAQSRIDCVVATFDGTTTEPYNLNSACGIGTDGGGGQNEIPEPGSLALAGLALLGACAARRRKL